MSDISDLNAVLHLDDVRIYETRYRTDLGFRDEELSISTREIRRERRDSGEPEQEIQNWDISVTTSPRRFECRARVYVQMRECRYLVDAAVIYKASSPVAKPGKDLIKEFIQGEALPALFPFIRAEVKQASQKIRGPRQVLNQLSAVDVSEAVEEAFSDQASQIESASAAEQDGD